MEVFPSAVAALEVTVHYSEENSKTMLEYLKRTLQEVQEMAAPFVPFMEEADGSSRSISQQRRTGHCGKQETLCG